MTTQIIDSETIARLWWELKRSFSGQLSGWQHHRININGWGRWPLAVARKISGSPFVATTPQASAKYTPSYQGNWLLPKLARFHRWVYGLRLPQIKRPSLSLSWPRWGTIVLVVATLGLATVLTAVAWQIQKGYSAHDMAWWRERVDARRMSALELRNGTLLTAIGYKPNINYADFGYLSAPANLPRHYVEALVYLEDRRLFDPNGSLLYVAGIDWFGVIRGFSQLRGGSNLVTQATKNLLKPDIQRPAGGAIGSLTLKLQEYGHAMQLYKALGAKPEAVVRLYAEVAPLLIEPRRGTVNGITAASHIVFGVPPDRLTTTQQMVLAAAAKFTLIAVAPGRIKAAGSCAAINPHPKHRPVSSGYREGSVLWRHCQVLARARLAVPHMSLSAQEQADTLAQIAGYEEDGIRMASAFEPAPVVQKDQRNLVTRARGVVPPSVVRMVESSVQAQVNAGKPVPERVVLTLDEAITSFPQAVNDALKQVETSPAGFNGLCTPLTVAGKVHHCGPQVARAQASNPDLAQAYHLLLKMDLVDGSVLRLAESSRLVGITPVTVGSTSKLVIALAAVLNGFGADSLVCPKQASDGTGRQLRRVAGRHGSRNGVAACADGPNGGWMTLRQAMAKSDNLAMLDLARRLGDPALLHALKLLGLTPRQNVDLAYQLSYGLLVATPYEMAAMTQPYFALMYSQPLRRMGPKLISQPGQATPALSASEQAQWQQLQREVTPAMRTDLRSIFEAVAQPGGTLSSLAPWVLASKTGTTDSQIKAGDSALVSSKWVLATDGQHLYLALFGAANNGPLGAPKLQISAFKPAIRTLFTDRFSPPSTNQEHAP